MRLELQQPGMERRRINSTRYLGFQRRMQWRLDWRFPAAAETLLTDNRCTYLRFGFESTAIYVGVCTANGAYITCLRNTILPSM